MTFLGPGKGLMKQEGGGLCAPCHHGDTGSKVIIKTFLHQKAIFTSQGEVRASEMDLKKKKKSKPVCMVSTGGFRSVSL